MARNTLINRQVSSINNSNSNFSMWTFLILALKLKQLSKIKFIRKSSISNFQPLLYKRLQRVPYLPFWHHRHKLAFHLYQAIRHLDPNNWYMNSVRLVHQNRKVHNHGLFRPRQFRSLFRVLKTDLSILTKLSFSKPAFCIAWTTVYPSPDNPISSTLFAFSVDKNRVFFAMNTSSVISIKYRSIWRVTRAFFCFKVNLVTGPKTFWLTLEIFA